MAGGGDVEEGEVIEKGSGSGSSWEQAQAAHPPAVEITPTSSRPQLAGARAAGTPPLMR
jgi:hypothetical protein